MGFRYRKSIKAPGGFRINLSKSGVGYSWGFKGFRIAKTARGTTRVTTSVPGTGISHVKEYKNQPKKESAIQNMDTNENQEAMTDIERFYFDGTILQLVGYSILAALLTSVTFGIGYPWALCMLQRWETGHTLIGSRRLKFTGTGLQLLGKWIILAVIPFAVLIGALAVTALFIETKAGIFVAGIIGIVLLVCGFLYGYFVVIELKKWTLQHTDFEVYISQYSPSVADIQPGPGPRPAPNTVSYRPYEKDWVDKIQPALPLIYVVWFCGIAAATWGILSLIFK